METGSVLEVGDVVVVPQVRESHLVYVVHAEGGSDQLTYQTRNEATAHAIAHARQRRVNAWYGDRPELGLVLLGWFRERTGGCERAATEKAPSNSPSLDQHALFVHRTMALDEKVINKEIRRIPGRSTG